jgi:hypothetical protein
VASTNHTREKFWTDWTFFVHNYFGIPDPLLTDLPHPERLALVQAFAHWVRSGNTGRNDRVGTKRVQQALAAVAKTFQLDHQPSPTYQEQSRAVYWPSLKQQIECYRREDPPPQRKLAVPITVPHSIVVNSLYCASPKQQALADLICVAFYFLLRVGEYTYSKPKRRTRTQRFRVKDVTLRRGDQSIIPHTAPLAELLTATHATLMISNQKNGCRGQCIHHHCTGLVTSPVKALARRIAHIMSHTTDVDTALSTYYDLAAFPQQIKPADVNKCLKSTVISLGLERYGITRELVSSHSLRAGGAMAMSLNGIDPIVIKKQGRWSSNTFMQYIHEQIGAFTAGVAVRMSRYIPYHNMDPSVLSPQVTEPQDVLETTPR